MKKNIHGNITIRISDDEMTAFLDYVPSDVLFEWSDEKILELLDRAGVKRGFKQFQFSRIFDLIEKKQEQESYIIARGVEPVSGKLSKLNIAILTMTQSLEPVYNHLINNSEKPIVYPLQDDYKLGVESEQLSYDVLNHYYVNKDDIIFTIDPEGKPKNGYSVKGNIVKPSRDDDENFCFANSFEIDLENKIIKAEQSGFIRIGKNWIDFIPFKGHNMFVEPSEDFAEYYLTFNPSDDAPVPHFNDIINLFAEIDYPFELFKSEDIILSNLKKAIIEKKKIKFSLTKNKKSVARIEINKTNTKATLILVKGAGPGQRLSLKYIGALIRDSKIKGMNLEAVKKRILRFYKSSELSLEYVIVEGRTATRGEPRRLKFQKEFVSVDKIEGIINRITDDIETFYPSFKEFSKDSISSAILVNKGFEFALLTDPVPGDDGTDIYGNKIKGLVGNDPIIKTYENIIIKQNKYISKIDGILDLGEDGDVTLLRVREHKDMFVDISVSNDAMTASFTFHKEDGSGEQASIEFINKQIEAAGVVKGIDHKIIEESFEKFTNGELISEVVFATGRVPTDKKSSRIKFFNNNTGASKFSYEIEKGQKIAQIFPSKEKAEDGYDVLGTVMESSGVISLDLKIGDYILEEKQADDSIILSSDINGELKVDDKTITIVDMKVLSSDVSIKTGSIKTLCSLVVKGNVMSSLYVVSGGNVKILGTVQGALVSADKNIIIAQGVKGEEKAVLRAKEKIDVKFIEKGNMMAVDDIHIRKASLHTKIISNGRILFDKNGSKIIGGEAFSKHGLTVDEIGSPSGSKTFISFGQDYLVADKIKVFEKDVENIQEDLMKLDQVLQGGNSRLSQDKIAHLRKQKVFLMKKLEKKNMKLFLLREKFEEHAKSEIIIRNKIYPGVVFESHGRKLEIVDEQPMCRITFNPNTGQIEKSFN